MDVKQRFVKGGLQIILGQAGQQALVLARNVVLARLLPPEHFAIGLTFVTIVTALDAVSELGIELFIVRSPDGDSPGLQANLHAVLMVRGIAAAIALFLLAGPLSLLFHAPEAAGSFQFLALIPLFRCLLHLDIRRFDRTLDYGPGVVAGFLSVAAGTLTAAAAAYLAYGYHAMLAAYVVQVAVLTGLSHWYARRPYQMSFERQQMRSLMKFSTPLLANGILIYLIAQGDRILVGASLGLMELAAYGTASILTSGITMLAMRASGQLYLPLLSNLSAADPVYERRYEICGALSALSAIVSILTFTILGPSILAVAFGSNYAAEPLLLLALGLHSGFRIFRSWPQIAMLADGRTLNLLVANIISTSGLAFAAYAIWLGYGIVSIAVCYAAAEFLSMVYCILRSMFTQPAGKRSALMFCVIVAGTALLASVMRLSGLVPGSAFWEIAAALALIALAAMLILKQSLHMRGVILLYLREPRGTV